MDKETFNAVLGSDINELLDSLGLKESFLSGNLKCSHCKQILSNKNIFSIYPLSGDIKLSCNKAECIEKTTKQTMNR